MKDSPEKDRFIISQMLLFLQQCFSHSDAFKDPISLSKSFDDFTIIQRDIEQIGEGLKSLSSEAKIDLGKRGIPVAEIVAMRNHLAHPYFDFDPQFIFPICKNDLPILRKALLDYLASLPH
jgi:uncharacterized protein with HEPN domain